MIARTTADKPIAVYEVAKLPFLRLGNADSRRRGHA